jgi:acyl-coenzyme A thioesterase PaaI-like protein
MELQSGGSPEKDGEINTHRASTIQLHADFLRSRKRPGFVSCPSVAVTTQGAVFIKRSPGKILQTFAK